MAVGRGAIGKEVKHGGLTLGVEERGAALREHGVRRTKLFLLAGPSRYNLSRLDIVLVPRPIVSSIFPILCMHAPTVRTAVRALLVGSG